MPTSSNFLYKFGPRCHCHHFFSKSEFWAEIFSGESSHVKNRLYKVFKFQKAQKWVKKEAKTSVGSSCLRCVTVSTDWQFLAVSESFLGFLGSKNDVDPIYPWDDLPKKNSAQNSNFEKKWYQRHLGQNF